MPRLVAGRAGARRRGVSRAVLAELKPFARGASPTFRDLSALVRSKGEHNDLTDLANSIFDFRDVTVRPGTYNGKILRLNTDGTTPDDQPGSSPVFASGLISPRAITPRSPSTCSATAKATGRTTRATRSRRSRNTSIAR